MSEYCCSPRLRRGGSGVEPPTEARVLVQDTEQTTDATVPTADDPVDVTYWQRGDSDANVSIREPVAPSPRSPRCLLPSILSPRSPRFQSSDLKAPAQSFQSSPSDPVRPVLTLASVGLSPRGEPLEGSFSGRRGPGRSLRSLAGSGPSPVEKTQSSALGKPSAHRLIALDQYVESLDALREDSHVDGAAIYSDKMVQESVAAACSIYSDTMVQESVAAACSRISALEAAVNRFPEAVSREAADSFKLIMILEMSKTREELGIRISKLEKNLESVEDRLRERKDESVITENGLELRDTAYEAKLDMAYEVRASLHTDEVLDADVPEMLQESDQISELSDPPLEDEKAHRERPSVIRESIRGRALDRHASRMSSFAAFGQVNEAVVSGFCPDDGSALDYYVLQENVWDLSILIGLPHMGSVASIFATCMLITNAFMQICLCFIINDTFTTPEIDSDTIDAMANWRVLSGHSFDFVSEQTFEPLAKRICQFDAGVPMSSGVSRVLALIEGYMPSLEYRELNEPYIGYMLPHFESIGSMMCVLALIIWVMNVTVNISVISSLASALIRVPTARKTVFMMAEDGGRVLLTMSLARKCFCCLVVCLQLFVATFLGITGCLYMTFTISMRDLLLNCSALNVVLELDELFYAAFTPQQAKNMLVSMQPLPLLKPLRFRGVNTRSLVALVGTIVAVAVTVPTLQHQKAQLRNARSEICDGNQNVVAIVDQAGILTAGNAPQLNPDYKSGYLYQAMRQLIKDQAGSIASKSLGSSGSMSATVSGMTGAQFSIAEARKKSVQDMAAMWNTLCVDMLPPTGAENYKYASFFLHNLQTIMRNTSISNCRDVEEYCSWDNTEGVRIRTMCPVTCGCNDPGSSLVLVGTHNGCPKYCATTPLYNTSRWSRKCEDEGIESKLLSRYAQGLQSFRASWPSTWRGDLDKILARIRAEGCGVTTQPFSNLDFHWEDACQVSGNYNLKPLAYACPESCRCGERLRGDRKLEFELFCPETC